MAVKKTPPSPVPVKKTVAKRKPRQMVAKLVEEIPEEEIPTTPPEIEEVPVTEAEEETTSSPSTQTAPVDPTIIGPVDKEKLLTFIEDIIDTLTFKRVGLIALLTVISLVLFSFYENRNTLVETLIHADGSSAPIMAPANWVLSDTSKATLQNLAKTTAVSFIAVSDVDLQKNRRSVRYYYLDDPNIKLSGEAVRALGLPQAVFDYDPKNTAQMVAILSNEFKCDKYRDTIYYRYAPELETQIPTVCRLAVPPFVGSFVGFITVGLGTMASKQELDSIRLEVSRIAVDIYLNDVIKKPAGPSGP